jgi:hypothetical protein
VPLLGACDKTGCVFGWRAGPRLRSPMTRTSPDDPALADYWASRRRRSKPPLDSYTLGLLTRQDGHCPLCGDYLLGPGQPPQSPREWEQWWLQVTRKAIAASYLVHGRPGPAGHGATCLVDASCHRGPQARQRRNPAQPAPRPRGLPELPAAKAARAILRGPGQKCAPVTRPPAVPGGADASQGDRPGDGGLEEYGAGGDRQRPAVEVDNSQAALAGLESWRQAIDAHRQRRRQQGQSARLSAANGRT